MLFKLETNWGKYFDATSQTQRPLGEMCGVPDSHHMGLIGGLLSGQGSRIRCRRNSSIFESFNYCSLSSKFSYS